MGVDPSFAGDGHVLPGTRRVGPDDLRRDNAAALLAGLGNPSEETFAGLAAALHRRLRAPGREPRPARRGQPGARNPAERHLSISRMLTFK